MVSNPASVGGVVLNFSGEGGTPTQLQVAGNTISLQPTGAGTQATLVPTGNVLAVQLTQGGLTLRGEGSAPPPLVIGANTLLAAGEAGTELQATLSNGVTQVVVNSGSVTLPATAGNVAGKLFVGEMAQFDAQGNLLGIELVGTSANPVGMPSSPVNSSITLPTIPRLDGSTARAPDQTFLNLLNQTLNAAGAQYSRSSAGQNAHGGITLTVGGAKVACAPVGALSYNSGWKDGMAVNPDGSVEVVVGGVKVTLIPMLHELARLNSAFPGSTLQVSRDGAVVLTSPQGRFSFRPAWYVTSGTATDNVPYVVNAQGQAVFVLQNGERQALYPAFKDIGRLQQVLRMLDANAVTSVDGTAMVKATLQGQTLRLLPDYAVVDAARKDDWWIADGKIYLRYTDGTAQGFIFWVDNQ